MYKQILILFLIVIFSSCDKNSLKVGTFEIYEDEIYIGKIYRLNNYQIEEYPKTSLLISQLSWKNDTSFVLKGTEINPKGIDTIQFLNFYSNISKNKYSLLAIPINSKFDYEYNATIVKKSNTIDKKFLDTLLTLNKMNN